MKVNNAKNTTFENIKKFLETEEKKGLMEICYGAIREETKRVFDGAIYCWENEIFDAYFPLVSAVIFTANKFECDTLNYLVSTQKGGTVHKRRDKIHIFENNDMHSPVAYILKLSSSYILHLLANETGSYTPGGSSDLVRYVSATPTLRPSCIISYGICYGRDPNKQMIGDVLIPRKLYPWSIGQKVVDKKLKIKHDDFNLYLEEKFSHNNMYSSISSYCEGEDGKAITKRVDINGQECEFNIRVSYGNMSTGEAVISSKILKDKIISANRNEKEIGGEMEGYGLVKECVYYAKIPCVIIKGICDWGELKNIEKAFRESGMEHPDKLKDKLQAYAAFCAGIVLLDLISLQKDKFLKLGVVEWIKKERICAQCHYAKAEQIKSTIDKFFNNEIDSNFLFDQLVELKKLIMVENNYDNTVFYRIEKETDA